MSFQQGLSGLNAASRNLDVIGNNIANANTTGFKGSRSEFADIVASSIGAAGGSNAGIGVEVAAVAQQFSQGNITVTGNNLDVAINGGGFFRLQQPDGSPAYTRAGNFKLDTSGDLVTNSGAKVMGFKVDSTTGAGTSEPVPLSFPTGAPIQAKQTANITAAINLDARAKDAASTVPPTPRSTYGTSVNVYDSQGVAVPVNLYFVKTATANTWDVYDKLDDPTATPPVVATSVGTVAFDANGAYDPTASTSPLTVTVDPSGANPNNPPAPWPVTIDLSSTTQFGSKFSVADLTQDGYASGELTGINISNDGMVMASYSNGVTRAEAQVALANFRNPQGLAPVGGNNWVETNTSGAPVVGKPGTGNLGNLRAGALEDSNVDLTADLVNMMTAQRAYQANAQTIKTQDQIMSTLVNLR
ncbi:flagellar hook protein FlgE [Simplicispira hankyongi]|jgi:flagellar hook protein FlgE|uniref:Flagellar hook protein FlgE n=1 Tax=Simplicispira hankyongi TaxID=2315688 RepID=A0A398C542_9BURK|nr:flagellar hook protein FlgE [Simplicispira hankyongi]RID97294.1 flagellar hook protein FlgE [Simplicispira hankyongi]